MPRWARWIVRGVLAVLGLVAVAIIAVLIALHTDWGRNLVREQIVKQLRAAFPGGARLARLDGSVLGTLVLRGVELDARDGKPWITIGELDVDVALWPLVGRTVRIDSLVVDDVAVEQRPQPPRPPELETKREPSPWTIELVHGEIHRARVRVVSESRTIELSELEVTASATYAKGAASASLSARGRWTGHALAVSGLVYYGDGTFAAPYAEVHLDDAVAQWFGVQLDDVIQGDVIATVPAHTLAELAHVTVPGDIALAVSVSRDGALDVRGALAGASLRVIGARELQGEQTPSGGTAAPMPLRADALAIAEIPDGTVLDPRLAGRARATAVLSGGFDGVRGMVAIDAERPLDKQLLGAERIAGTAFVAFDATLAGAWVVVDSAADLGGTRAEVVANVTRATDGSLALTRSSLVASASRIGHWTSDAHVGTLGVRAAADGPLWPKPDLHATGSIEGTALRYGPARLATATARFDTHHVTQANVHLDLGGASLGKRPLGSASFDLRAARNAGGVIDIAIDKHVIATAANGTWSGTGGRVRIDPARIAVEDLHTSSGAGDVIANASLDRATSSLRVTATASKVALATLQPDFGGTVDATIDVQHSGGRWNGSARVHGKGVAGFGQPPMDVDAALDVHGQRVQVSTTAVAPAGKVAITGDLDGPYDITDARAWQRLERKALRNLTLSIDGFQLAKVGASGTVTGTLAITGSSASGGLALHGLQTPRGTVDADLSLAPDPNGVLANISAQLERVDTATGTAVVALPSHPFDPVAWRTLGRRALHQATVQLAPLDFDPGVLAHAGLQLPYRGHLQAKLDIAAGASAIAATVDVTKLSGGAIVQPVAVHVQANMTGQGLRVTGLVSAGTAQLVTIDAGAPLTPDVFAAWRAQPLSGTIAIPNVPAAQIVAVLGRRDVSGGVVDGSVELGGTIGTPTAKVALAATDVTIPAAVTGRAPSKLESLTVAGAWDGTAGKLIVNGKEASGGTIAITAQGRPDQPTTIDAAVDAVKLDLAPFAAFAVGALSAARGTLDAKLALHGFDPDTGELSGTLDLHDARLPVSPLLGTLRAMTAHVVIANHAIDATLAAKLGKGDLKGTAKVALTGSTPTTATANVELHEISLVRAMQPSINATVAASFTHERAAWRGTIDVHHGRVTIATSGGVELLPSDAPSDMQFTDQPPSSLVPLLQRPAPKKPWLFATIDLGHTNVDVVQDGYQLHGAITGKLKLSVGEGIGMDGSIEAVAQNLEILGARAQLDHATITFDGTLDPMLDVVALREITEGTITASVSGRASKPVITMSSDSGSYSQGELIGYFLGGAATSGGGSSAGSSDLGQTAAAAAGAGAASALVTSQLRKVLPKSLAKYAQRMSFSYEVGTASSSEGFRFGYWVQRHVFVALHQHLEPLPDENGTEGIVEWHFRNTMMLQGNAGDRGIAGLDLVRRWRW